MLTFTGVTVDPRATKGKRKKVFSFLSKPKVFHTYKHLSISVKKVVHISVRVLVKWLTLRCV